MHLRVQLLALLIILLPHNFIRNTRANKNDKLNDEQHDAIHLRRHIQQSSGRQSNTDNCELNSYGVYGTIDTSETSSINIIYSIEYLYQVSVIVGTTTTQFSSDILRPLDGVITTAIIPSFFPNCKTNRLLQTAGNNGAIITAISSTPVDTYVPTGCKSYNYIFLLRLFCL
jgi:hypothetical protein